VETLKVYLTDWSCNARAGNLIRKQAKSRHLSVDKYLRELIVSALIREEETARNPEPPPKRKARA